MTAGMKTGLLVLAVVVFAVILLGKGKSMVMGAERKEPIPAPVVDEPHVASTHETAVFAGGMLLGRTDGVSAGKRRYGHYCRVFGRVCVYSYL